MELADGHKMTKKNMFSVCKTLSKTLYANLVATSLNTKNLQKQNLNLLKMLKAVTEHKLDLNIYKIDPNQITQVILLTRSRLQLHYTRPDKWVIQFGYGSSEVQVRSCFGLSDISCRFDLSWVNFNFGQLWVNRFCPISLSYKNKQFCQKFQIGYCLVRINLSFGFTFRSTHFKYRIGYGSNHVV